MVIWICGLSGAGKTTIGSLLYDHLKPNLPNLLLLDGDEFRQALSGDIGHDPDARLRNSLRIANLLHLFDRQDIHAICCAVTISPEAQKLNRDRLSDYVEVFLDVPLPVLEKRDPKDIYRRAREQRIKNVAGVDIPYQPPAAPHLRLENKVDLDDLWGLAQEVLHYVPRRFLPEPTAARASL